MSSDTDHRDDDTPLGEARAEHFSGNQGQTWRDVEKNFQFKRPRPLFDRPMEITVNMLRGLRMVDETVVVYGAPTEEKAGE